MVDSDDRAEEPRRFLFLVASARSGGNTELLARMAAASLPRCVGQEWLRLRDLPLPPFRDIRHEGSGIYPDPVGNEYTLFDATLRATDIVIASPLYWYNVSASAKLYLDYWSAWMRVPAADFKRGMSQKTLWAITAMSDEDATEADELSGCLQRCARYFDMPWGGLLLGRGNRPGDVAAGGSACLLAATFFACAQDDSAAESLCFAQGGTTA